MGKFIKNKPDVDEDILYPWRVRRPDGRAYALGQYISMSAHKARRVIDQIRGRSYEQTLMILELMPYRACYPIYKLIYSAAANASHNKGFNKANLFVVKAEVNEGTTLKKLKPRARGRSYPIRRPTCQIVIVLYDISLLYETLYEKECELYEEDTFCLKKTEWKKKYNDMTYHNMYNSGGLWDKK
uniref:Large ribosomal subunit protein uL22c n=1 Tax=Cuphea spruceana TaxID=3062351 RepID=A0AA49J6M5_9MYRT|nr:ribosomal protein L22 [Cuphea spruceana]WKK46418.1 ribosomal protein L22 [Cuphea spruceana]